MNPIILRGQDVKWPASLFEDDLETIPLSLVGGTLTVFENKLGVPITLEITNAANGLFNIKIDAVDTVNLKKGAFNTFRIKFVKANGDDIVWGDVAPNVK